MTNSIERKTIFLYPDYEERTRNEFLKVQELISKIKQIINCSNDHISDLLNSGGFSKIKCMPSIVMKCTDDISEDNDKYDNVRICILKYDDTDFSDAYNEIVSEYKSGNSQISHLVAVHIKSDIKQLEVKKDEEKNFDILIETSLEDLEKILLSIMFDISLYHYFSLSNELKSRRDFNYLKCSYILEQYEKEEIKRVFGNDELDCAPSERMYLPFPLREIQSIKNIADKEINKEVVNKLINEYAQFLVEKLSTTIGLNENGNIVEPYSYKDTKHFDYIQKMIEDSDYNFSEFVVIILENATEKLESVVLEYNNGIKPWTEKLSEDVIGYQIFKFLKQDRGNK